MGICNINRNTEMGTLEQENNNNVIQLSRIDDNIHSSDITKIPYNKQEDNPTHRQHNISIPNNESKHPSPLAPIEHFEENLGILPKTPSRIGSKTYQRNREYRSRQIKQKKKQQLRMETKRKGCQTNRKGIRKYHNRPFRNKHKHNYKKICEQIRNSWMLCCGCNETYKMGEQLTSEPASNPFESSPQEINPNEINNHTNYSKLANTELVPHSFTTSNSETDNSEDNSISNIANKEHNSTIQRNSRLEAIREKAKSLELSTDAMELIINAERKSTTKTYNWAWNTFKKYCARANKNYNEFSIVTAIEFLTEQSKTSIATFNTCKSALSSTWKILFPERYKISEHPLIIKLKQLMKGISRGKKTKLNGA